MGVSCGRLYEQPLFLWAASCIPDVVGCFLLFVVYDAFCSPRSRERQRRARSVTEDTGVQGVLEPPSTSFCRATEVWLRPSATLTIFGEIAKGGASSRNLDQEAYGRGRHGKTVLRLSWPD
jgi:hypothetical protein